MEDPSWSLTDGERWDGKQLLLRRWPTICSLRTSCRFVPSSAPLFSAISFSPSRFPHGSPHSLSRQQLSLYFSSHSVLLFFIFLWGWYDAITGENVKTFPADEAVSIIAGILHFSKENLLLDHPLSYSISFRRLFVSSFWIFPDNSRVCAAAVAVLFSLYGDTNLDAAIDVN